jgi:Domain of unknown function (DU1801)
MKAIDQFYQSQQEPIKSCLLALSAIILQQDKEVSAEWKYGMPFFCYKGKMFCYLWVHKKYPQPYIGVVEGKHIDHPDLLTEKRSRIKIMLFNPDEDLPIKTIETILQQALNLYRTGVIKIKNA